MPRVKQPIRQHGELCAYAVELEEFVSRFPGINKIQPLRIYGVLQDSALHPEKLGNPANDNLRAHFCDLFANHPDFVIEFLRFVRELHTEPGHCHEIRRFIRSHPEIKLEQGRAVKINDATAGEIARAIKLAGGSKVSKESVEKERAAMAKRDDIQNKAIARIIASNSKAKKVT